MEVPVMVVERTADAVVVPHMAQQILGGVTSALREVERVTGGTHCFEEQPDLLDAALDALAAWITRSRGNPT
jgi:hypothetical protein